MCKPFVLISLGFSLLFVSCAAKISGVIHENGSADISITASLEPKTAALLQSLSANSGSFFVDAASIGISATAAPGVSSAQFKNINSIAVEGHITIEKIDDFLLLTESSGGNYRFVSYRQNSSEEALSINLDLTRGPDIINLFSSDVASYLEAIMAPLATGEVLTVAEYLDLVTSVYGSNVSNEIKSAVVSIDFTVPGSIKTVKGGSFAKDKAVFSVPLAELLVLEKPIAYEIVWSN
jgi:hypothetical protein